jgi:hypothetical protein
VIIVRQPYEVLDQARTRLTLALEVSQLHHSALCGMPLGCSVSTSTFRTSHNTPGAVLVQLTDKTSFWHSQNTVLDPLSTSVCVLTRQAMPIDMSLLKDFLF